MKKAFITGITGQDGSYLAEFLLAKGYDASTRQVHEARFDRKGVRESQSVLMGKECW